MIGDVGGGVGGGGCGRRGLWKGGTTFLQKGIKISMSTFLAHKRPHTPLSVSYLGTPNGQHRHRSRPGWSGFGWTTFSAI